MSDYQVMPPLSAEEYDALKADIAEHGIRVPVDVDEDGNLLDGHHRAAIAAELGIDYPTRVVSGLGEEGKRHHALAVNAQRRTLSREQRRELIRVELQRDPLRSDRAIGRRLGVDGKTVGAVRQEHEEAERERQEELERNRREHEEEAVAYTRDRVAAADSRRENVAFAGWVQAHKPELASGVTEKRWSLKWAAGEVTRLTGCELFCEHTPEPPRWAVETAEFPQYKPPLGTIGPYKVHPFLDLFPWVDDDLFACIAESIKKIGLVTPILLNHDRTILVDGRIRYAACELTGVEPWYKVLPEDADLGGIVLAVNGVRTSLTRDQWAMEEAHLAANGGSS